MVNTVCEVIIYPR